MAPEVFRNEGYDTKVDVFSFALILQEVMDFITYMPRLSVVSSNRVFSACRF